MGWVGLYDHEQYTENNLKSTCLRDVNGYAASNIREESHEEVM